MRRFTKQVPKGWHKIARSNILYQALQAEAQRINHPFIDLQVRELAGNTRSRHAEALQTLKKAVREGEDLWRVVL